MMPTPMKRARSIGIGSEFDLSLFIITAAAFGCSLPGFVDLPLGRSNFRKIKNMDDDSRRMDRDERISETFTVTGPGIFIFDVSDWSNDCYIEAAITVDGELWFSTSSYALERHKVDASQLANWHTTWTPHVRRTDDREMAFYLD
jgi:hypothetical protein